MAAAVAACLVSSAPTVWRLNRLPWPVGNSGSPGSPERSLNPGGQDRNGLAGQGRRALLSSFAGDLAVSTGAELDVIDVKADELRYAHAGLDHEQQQRMVAAAEPGAGVGSGEQRLDLCRVEVVDDGVLVAFGRDRHHPGDRPGVLGVAQRSEPVERMDRCEPRVTRARTVVAVVFEVVEERPDQRRVEVVEIELERLFAGLLAREGQEQPECVAICSDRLRAGVALRDQTIGEPCLQCRGECGHHSTSPSWPRR